MRRYFEFVHEGSIVYPRATLRAALGPEAHAALCAAGLLRGAPRRDEWPCDADKSCYRDVMPNVPGRRAPFVAVCSACEDEDPCLAVDLTADDLAQESVAWADLVRMVRALYRVDGRAAPPPRSPGAEPVHLGVEREREPPRDVFLAMAPHEPALALFLVLRERVPRPTLVLVPTARRLEARLVSHYGPGGHVELEVLEDAVTLRGGAPTLAPRLRVVSQAAQGGAPSASDADAESAGGPGKGLAAKLGAKTWKEIKITVVDGHTVRIQANKRTVRRTYTDLGIMDGRSSNPSQKWAILLAVCAGHGVFRWKTFGEFETVKQAVFQLSAKMRAAFGLEEGPFHKFHKAEGWKARFFAASEVEEEEGGR